MDPFRFPKFPTYFQIFRRGMRDFVDLPRGTEGKQYGFWPGTMAFAFEQLPCYSLGSPPNHV